MTGRSLRSGTMRGMESVAGTPQDRHGARAGYEPAPPGESGRASRRWWDRHAPAYLDEHGAFLGDDDLCWGPEGLRESEAGLLGPVAGLRGKRVLELGAGAAQGSRWLARHGVMALATDISGAMLAAGRRLDTVAGVRPTYVQADARALPFADHSFDLVFTAYGAIPFVPDVARVHAAVARVLRPGGRWVSSFSHPIRWAFPDDAGEAGLTVRRSYFDRTPYTEFDDDGALAYVEHHHTLGDHVRAAAAADLRIVDVVEPEWPLANDQTWGGWSPLRGALIPGTVILVCESPTS